MTRSRKIALIGTATAVVLVVAGVAVQHRMQRVHRARLMKPDQIHALSSIDSTSGDSKSLADWLSTRTLPGLNGARALGSPPARAGAPQVVPTLRG